ncbi:sarco/endoplasmic reticulum calcium transporting ATPase [Baffinella frigidus]|nr:sarco/endoplasmic reticulum calcium transporting ATPase [Cryptophyta sp. CCMP2293]
MPARGRSVSRTRTPAKGKASPRKRSKSPARGKSPARMSLAKMVEVAHTVDTSDVLEACDVDPEVGLSSSEVEKLRMVYGRNELPKAEGESLLAMFLSQFEDPLVRILLAAAGISLVSAVVEGTSEGLIEFGVIMTILIFNAMIGVWQEKRANDAIEALQSYNPEKATVIRDGERSVVLASELVPSDIVEVAVGDKVPADLRVVKMMSTAIKVEQAALTGESASVNKNPDITVDEEDCELQQKTNCLFSGTDLVYGKCVGMVIKTGSKTEIGKIAKSLQETEDSASPLKQKLDDFGELLTKIITWICIACWAINLFSFKRKGELMQKECAEGMFGVWSCWLWGSLFYFKEAVALAVAAIPEGLPAVVTTCLALGTRRMAKRNALIRHLPAVETLGCCSVICSDKTGTLTTNQMSVQKILFFGKSASDQVELDVEGITYEPKGDVMSMCNLSNIALSDKGVWDRIGESTEAALKVLVEKLGRVGGRASGSKTPCNDLWLAELSRETILEFSRDRKSMGVVVMPKGKAGKKGTLLVKGAPESVVQRCTRAMLENGETVPMTDKMRDSIISKVENEYGSGMNALRCLAHAFLDNVDPKDKRFNNPNNFVDVEQGMTFVGLVGILDPPRVEVKPAIETCRAAGIRVIVITGDNPKTAETICRKIGVFGENEDLTGKSFTGKEFGNMSYPQKLRAVQSASLFSRTEPMHKQQIVECLQDKKGPAEVAAMTGDGVNDAPALNAADIGVAMGSGTAVAQGASKMVLADDNFNTIVSAVEEGRAIYNNTKAFIRYLISSNIGEVVCIFLAVMLGIPEVLVPVTLLWVNLVTDGLPATALSFNPPETDIMTKPPRRRDEQLLSGWILIRYFVIGAYVGFACVAGFLWWQMYYFLGPQMTFYQLRDHLNCDAEVAKTFANGFGCDVMDSTKPKTVSLSILVVVEMFNALNAISENESLIQMPPWVNPGLIITICLSISQHALILAVPELQKIFQVAYLNGDEWRTVVMFSFPVILLDELLKIVSRRKEAAEEDARKKYV